MRYFIYTAMTGMVFSMVQFGEVIARKSLGASGLQITLLTMSMPVAAITSLWWGRLIEGRQQKYILIFVGAAGYLIMSTGAFLNDINHMISMHLIFFLAFALFGPAENRILQQHVAPDKAGKTFGNASGYRMAVSALVAAGTGYWLNHVEGGYRNIYPIVALIGFVGLGIFATIPIKSNKKLKPVPINFGLILGPVKDVIILLKRRPDYLRFELAFMLYGMAFMMTLPVVPLFLVDDLGLDYATIGIARGTIPQVVMILAIPLLGRVFDRTTPHKMAAAVFPLLALYPAVLLMTPSLEGWHQRVALYFAFGLFGAAMSGVMVLWNVASLRFSGKEDAGVYQSVHIAFTGFRGMFAPLLGLGSMHLLGKTTALMISASLFILAGVMMVVVRKIDYRRGEATDLGVGNN
jgi:MFS family permease